MSNGAIVIACVFILILTALLVTAVIVEALAKRRRREQVNLVAAGWARQNGFRLISCKQQLVMPNSPFWNIQDDKPNVFRVVVELPNNLIGQGWLRCGNVRPGFPLPSVEMTWDKDIVPPAVNPPGGFPVVFPTEKDRDNASH